MPDWTRYGNEVRKIVIGKLGQGADTKPLEVDALPDLAWRFPQLTHLYLWNLTGLVSLTTLPEQLECLDLRVCPLLRHIDPLPVDLVTLILDDCRDQDQTSSRR